MVRWRGTTHNPGVMNLAYLALQDSLSAANTERSGTQSLSKGIHLMRMIAARPDFGWRLSDLAANSHLDKATVHRMLACMVEERLVEQRASDRHYLPGPLMYELGFAQPQRTFFHSAIEPTFKRFAQRLHGIALLLYRSGNEYVCGMRAGTLQLSGLMVHQGTRRPLFTSVGGIAILQTLAEDEVHSILQNNIAQELARRGAGRLAALQKMRDRSEQHGFGVNLGDVVPGVHALAVPVFNTHQRIGTSAIAALCIVGTAELYGEERLAQLREELESTATQFTDEAMKLRL